MLWVSLLGSYRNRTCSSRGCCSLACSMATIPKRKLGSQGLEVPAIGTGCMGLTWAYNSGAATPDAAFEQADQLFAACQKSGSNMLVTAWIYTPSKPGMPHNEEVVGRAIEKYGRDKWIIVDKIGQDMSKKPPFAQSPDELRRQLDESLARLRTDHLDLLVLNRPDPSIPIEDTMAVFKAFVAEGKAKYVGLSEATPDQIRRAHAVHPLTAIEQEYSLNTRDIEGELLATVRELGIGVLAYSPLGRGMLSATLRSRADIAPGDMRLHLPRFSEENIAKNAAKADALAAIASRKGCTSAQLALAWLLAKGADIVPIPGTTKPERLAENVGAASLSLSAADVAEIEANVPEADGERYPAFVPTWSKSAGAGHK